MTAEGGSGEADRVVRVSSNANIVQRLDRNAARDPRRVALIGFSGRRRERWTYGELAERVEALAAGWRAKGLGVGDRALVYAPMSLELYWILLSLWRIGAVAVFLDPWFTSAQIEAVCETVAPRALIATPMAFALLWRRAPLRRIPLRAAARRGRFFGPHLDLEAVARAAPRAPSPLAERASDDDALITFTSGTTGRPKGARRTHGFLAAQHAALEAVLRSGEHDVEFSHFPIFALNTLAGGRTAALPPPGFRGPARFRASELSAFLEDSGVTTVIASPAFFDAYALSDGRGARACAGVRGVFTGGGPVGARTLKRIARMFPQAAARVVYGSTEAEPISDIAAATALERLCADTPRGAGRCVGSPAPSIRVKICAPSKTETAPPAEVSGPEPGEVWVAGAHVCREYADDPEANRRDKHRDGDGVVWHRTGDWARRDAQGRLWLLGRAGEPAMNTTPLGAVEAALETTPGVERAAAAVRATDGAAALRVAWTPAPDEPRPAEEVERALRALCAERGWPLERLRRLKRLPTDPRHNTKLDRRRLGKWLHSSGEVGR